MSVFFYTGILAVGLGALWLAAFIWSLKDGQYDDLEGDARRILFEDNPENPHCVPDKILENSSEKSPKNQRDT